MTRIVFGNVMWVGRATVFCVGLAVILAVVLGVATTALAAVPGDPFKLGRLNTIDEISRLIGSTPDSMLRIDNDGTGTALDLRVEPGKAPMTVDSDEKVTELNADEVDGKSATAFLETDEKAADAAHADRAERAANAAKVDGKSASEIGVNGLSVASDTSDFDSDPSKGAEAQCPAGKDNS